MDCYSHLRLHESTACSPDQICTLPKRQCRFEACIPGPACIRLSCNIRNYPAPVLCRNRHRMAGDTAVADNWLVVIALAEEEQKQEAGPADYQATLEIS